MHVAAAKGNVALVQLLLDSGSPWNAVDAQGRTAGEYALEAGNGEVYELLLNAGIRAELILNCVARKHSAGVPNEQFLTQKLVYNEETKSLVDPEGHGIMMGWESPIMSKHAQIIVPQPGGDILNVGFGMGIIDRLIQERLPGTHTIVEAHPDVYAYMLKEGWDKKPGVRIVFGRWQDVLEELGQYDGIFFDTFGEFYEDLREFHEELPALLKKNGIYSFFNGLAGTNGFFHDVYCKIVDLEMRELGFTTEYIKEDIDVQDKVWDGINGKYFQLNYYNYPIIKWTEEEED
uniref:Protein arginine N-methyltransferase 2 n=1 Tax=Arcella intermedia TaxID=1963864 RepID=A0A6B2L9F0_9EUKA